MTPGGSCRTFEKMLYDNALLATGRTSKPIRRQATLNMRGLRETLDYVLHNMTDPAGGFYSTEDADSEGEEGNSTVWTPDEIDAVLGEAAGAVFGRVYDVFGRREPPKGTTFSTCRRRLLNRQRFSVVTLRAT